MFFLQEKLNLVEKYTTGYVRALICVLIFEEIQVLKLINPRKQHVEKLNRLAKKM